MSNWALELVEQKIDEQKGLLVGISRGLRDLTHRSTPRGKAKPDRKVADTLVKAACCELLRKTAMAPGRPRFDETAAEVAQRIYPGDRDVLDVIERAVVNPARTDTAGWAAELMQTTVADFLLDSQVPSAFAQLSARCLTVGVGGSVKVPSRVHPVTLVGAWIGEGMAKPVYGLALTSITMAPSKLAALCVFSEEITSMSTPSIEALVRDALQHDLGALLDTALLDANAATSVRPAGLWNGATAVTASTATVSTEAMLADLGALAGAVSNGAPDASVVYVANPKQAQRIAFSAPGYEGVIASGYMAAGSVGAIDANAIVTMTSGLEFQASVDATLHMETSPLPIATGPQGTAVIASPTISLFQADLIALRSVLRASWAKRRAGATALATGVTW